MAFFAIIAFLGLIVGFTLAVKWAVGGVTA